MSYGVPDDCWTVADAVAWIAFRVDPNSLEPADVSKSGDKQTKAKQATAKELTAIFDQALKDLNRAVRKKQIEARGRKRYRNQHIEAYGPREVIPPGFLDELRTIELNGQCRIRTDALDFKWLHDPEGIYDDVCFSIEDIQANWPAEPASLISDAGELPPLPPSKSAITRTGCVGRPTSWDNLVKPEWERRREAGTIESTRKEQAIALGTWLQSAHPTAPQIGEKAIYNHLPAGLWPLGTTARNTRPK